MYRVYFGSETAQVELTVDECKPLPHCAPAVATFTNPSAPSRLIMM